MNMQSTLLLFLSISSISSITSIKIETLKKCCSLGTNYADADLKCTSFQTPITGVSKEDEPLCLNSIDVCCKKQYREKQCDLGQKDAYIGKGCSSVAGQIEGTFRKDCCEACELGIQTSESEHSCETELGLGVILDGVFGKCCKDQLLTSQNITSTMAMTPSTKPTSKSKTTSFPSTTSSPTLPLVCEMPALCAHICIPTEDSYKCLCHDGFTLMADRQSCRAIKSTLSTIQRCTTNNPCDHECIDTGVAIKCSCYEGFELAEDKKTCKDIDECALFMHDCTPNEVCINLEGDFDCQIKNIGFNEKCPEGYKFDGERMVCDDINECEINLVCPKPSVCINTIGSFKCTEVETPQCPPGFYYNAANETCDDINECEISKNDCNKKSQTCLNTKGNYTCIDRASTKTCPPGFKKNPLTQQCEDINECEENAELCGENEECVNELGGHNCIGKLNTTQKSTPSFTTLKMQSTKSTPVSKITKNTTLQPQTTINLKSRFDSQTVAISTHSDATTESIKQSSLTLNSLTTPSVKPIISTQTSTIHQRPPYIYPSKPENPIYNMQLDLTCSGGYKYAKEVHGCMDIDECSDDAQICDSNQDCYNTVGSYICNCKKGFTKDYQTEACVDVNECQVAQHDCSDGQRCDNTIGSYLCSRTTGCGTGYTLNSGTGLCEDDDECVLGSHNCRDLGPKFQCRNTLGSYRCERIKCINDCTLQQSVPPSTTIKFVPTEADPTQSPPNYPVINQFKKCLPGYRMNMHGECEDINECESNPCQRSEKCINLNGRYQCIPLIFCKSGYELNEAGTSCEDINECARGTHRCKSSQICKNGPGYYICQCPPGHKLSTTNECEDINECEFYKDRICSRNANCINTVGSYICKCKEGFRENAFSCDDIDECGETNGLCHQNCINLWGSYRCSCNRGFTLSTDNRTCSDINECEKFKGKNLCVGECQNTPGSYSCQCPDGYRLGIDGRTCQDIDECQRNVCRNPDDICFNTRGSYKCHTIVCPPHYIKDPDHKSRCKRASNVCDVRDINCIRMPAQYSYHFVTFVSNLPIPDEGKIDFFQMKGPSWVSSTANFNMNILNVKCPRNIRKADEGFFRMKREVNKVVMALVQPIQGPQEIELQLQMELYITGVFQGKVVSTIFIYVSEYEF